MENHNNQLTVRTFIKTNTIMHLSFVVAVLLFSIIVYFLGKEWSLNFTDTDDFLIYLIPIFAIAGIFAGHYLYKMNISKLKNKLTLKDKLSGFQSAVIIKYALIEGPALFSIVTALNTENLYYLIIAAVLIVYLYLQKPSKELIESDLELNSEMRNQFNKMEQVID